MGGEKRARAAVRLEQQHLELDLAFASNAHRTKLENNEDVAEVSDIVFQARDALIAFETEHPDIPGFTNR